MEKIISEMGHRPLVYVVDDEEVNRIILRQGFKNMPVTVREFADGPSCLDALKHETPDVILLDVMLPEMDGFDVCRLIRANPANDDIPVLFVTAADTSEHRHRGLDLGAVDYVAKPIDINELRLRVKQHIRLRQLHLTIKAQKQRMEREIDSAKKIQARLLPANQQQLSPQLNFFYEFVPCESLAGDFLDLIWLDKDNILFYMADVAGHGVASSLITVFVKEFFQHYKLTGSEEFSLPYVLARLNEAVLDLRLDNRYLTIFVGVLCLKNYRLEWASAGPNTQPFIISEQGIQVLKNRGEPIGWFDGLVWQSHYATLHPGSTLLMYSDAACEVSNPAGQQLGMDGFEKMLYDSNFTKNLQFAPLVQALHNWADASSFNDDLTLMAFSRARGDHAMPQ